jgi:hypothetical protein
MELNMKYYDKGEIYCCCCGRKNQHIWKMLQKQKPIEKPGTIGKNVKEWKNHKVYSGNDYFYDTSILEYCGFCGEKLGDEDIHSVYESRGEYWGSPCREQVVTGYKCSNCGQGQDF